VIFIYLLLLFFIAFGLPHPIIQDKIAEAAAAV